LDLLAYVIDLSVVLFPPLTNARLHLRTADVRMNRSGEPDTNKMLSRPVPKNVISPVVIVALLPNASQLE
jgi:hypothetical protein